MSEVNDLENWYLSHEEPNRSCFLALKHAVLAADPLVEAAWKWGGPFFYYRGKVFCYLWLDKGTKRPYIGFYEGKHLYHPRLEYGKRTRIKCFAIDPSKDIPIADLKEILNEALDLYRSGSIKTPK
jgi:hypothetical protein